MSVIDEIVRSAPDVEIVFDFSVDRKRYMSIREFMWKAGSDILVLIPPRIVVSKARYLDDSTKAPETRHLIGAELGRNFYHEAAQPEPTGGQ